MSKIDMEQPWALVMYANGAMACVQAGKGVRKAKGALWAAGVASQDEGEMVITRLCHHGIDKSEGAPMYLPFPEGNFDAMTPAMLFLADVILMMREGRAAAIPPRFTAYKKEVGVFIPGLDIDVQPAIEVPAELYDRLVAAWTAVTTSAANAGHFALEEAMTDLRALRAVPVA